MNIEEKLIFEKFVKFLNDDKVKVNQSGIDFQNNITKDIAFGYSNEISRYVGTLKEYENNPAYRPLHTPQKRLSKITIFFKKVQRKIFKWYIEPIADQQTYFNKINTATVGRLAQLQNFYIKKIAEIDSKLVSIDDRFNNYLDFYNNIEENTRNLMALNKTVQSLKETNSHKSEELIEILHFQHKVQLHVDETFKDFKSRIDRLEQLTDSSDINNKNHINTLNNYRFENISNYSRLKGLIEMNFHLIQREIASQKSSDMKDYIKIYSQNERLTYAQSGEDSIIQYLLDSLNIPIEQIFYIDVGSNHAIELSNTFQLYEKGARGILVEANPLLVNELKRLRPEDIIVNKAVTVQKEDEIEFYVMTGDGLSSINYNFVSNAQKINPNVKIETSFTVKTIRINAILEEYSKSRELSVLSLDIEGEDFKVLKDFNFPKWKPYIVVIEMIKYDTILSFRTKNMGILKYMNKMGYSEYAFTGINSIFIRDDRFQGGAKI
jgi:FkbM family methyltransferase